EKQHINEVVQDFTTNIQRQQQAISNLIEFMQKIQENAGNHDLDETIRQLTNLSTLLGDFSNRLNELNNYVQNNDLQS
ncbi:hypothetical protein ACQ10A_16300, partial [Enterococcus faecalis]